MLTGRKSRLYQGGGLLISVAIALSLAACGSSNGGSGSSGSKTVTFGSASILSGPYAAYGAVGNGVTDYFDYVNAHGGINGYHLNLVTKDYAYQPARAVEVTRQFVLAGDLGIFEIGTPATEAALDGVGGSSVPLLCAGNGDLFTPPTRQNAFAASAQFSRLGFNEARFIMKQLGQKKFAFAYEDDDLGSTAGKAVPGYVSAQGGTLLANVPVSGTATNFVPYAQRLKDSGAKVVQAFVGLTQLVGLQKAAAGLGYNPKWVTFFPSLTPVYPSLAGKLANGVYADNYLLESGPAYNQFKAATQKYFPSLVTSQLAEDGWALAQIAVDALKTATANGKAPTDAAMIQALKSMKDVQGGLIPSVTFSGTTHAAASEAAMYEFQNGVQKQLTPYTTIPSGN